MAGIPATAQLWNDQWLIWSMTPQLDLDPQEGLSVRSAKHFLTTPFPASVDARHLRPEQSSPSALLQALRRDIAAAFTPEPLAVAVETPAAMRSALRSAMIVTGGYPIVDARHPAQPGRPQPLNVVGITTGVLHEPGRKLFAAILDLFQPTSNCVSLKDTALDASPQSIEIPNEDCASRPSHHEQIAEAANLRNLLEAHADRTGLDQNDIDALLNDALSSSAW